MANLRKANDLDPHNRQVAFWLGDTYRYMRRYSEEERLLTKRLALGEEEQTRYNMLVAEMKLAQGAPAQAQAFLEQVPLDFSPNEQIWATRFNAALYLRDHDAATRVLASIPANVIDDYFEGRPESVADGELARARGEKEKARAIFASVRKRLDTAWGDKLKDEAYFRQVSQLDAGLGRKEEAIREGLRAVELMPIASDSIAGTWCVTNLALVYAWTGERDRALEQLEIIATKPGATPSYGDLLLNPCWDDLRGHPRFDKIVAAAKAASR